MGLEGIMQKQLLVLYKRSMKQAAESNIAFIGSTRCRISWVVLNISCATVIQTQSEGVGRVWLLTHTVSCRPAVVGFEFVLLLFPLKTHHLHCCQHRGDQQGTWTEASVRSCRVHENLPISTRSIAAERKFDCWDESYRTCESVKWAFHPFQTVQMVCLKKHKTRRGSSQSS